MNDDTNRAQQANYQQQTAWQAPPQGAYPPPPQPPIYRPVARARTKSGFLTFCFAFMPGAGQMYLGYMKRGLSLCALFFGGIWLASTISPLMVLLPISWMYSFFDVFNLRSQLAAGAEPVDDYVIHLEENDKLNQLLRKRHNLLGWGLIAAGIWAIYETFLEPLVYSLCNRIGFWWLYTSFSRLPSLLLIGLMLWLGVWLVRGPRMPDAHTAQADEDIPYYTPAQDAAPAADPFAAQQPVQPATDKDKTEEM